MTDPIIEEIKQEVEIQQKNAVLAYAFLKAEEDGLGRFLPMWLSNDGKWQEAGEAIVRYGNEYIAANYAPEDEFTQTFEWGPEETIHECQPSEDFGICWCEA